MSSDEVDRAPRLKTAGTSLRNIAIAVRYDTRTVTNELRPRPLDVARMAAHQRVANSESPAYERTDNRPQVGRVGGHRNAEVKLPEEQHGFESAKHVEWILREIHAREYLLPAL